MEMPKSNFELNMVAQPGTSTAATLSNIEIGTMKDNERNGNPMTQPPPAMAIHDLGAGPGADSDNSSSPSSPAKAPPQKRVHRSASQPARDRSRERRSEGGTARVSKSFAPTRLVHRKVEAAQPTAAQASWQGGRFQQIDAQFDADREAIQKLQQAVMALDARSLSQHEQLLKLQKTDEDAKRDAFEMEKAILHRVEAAKAFAAKDTETRVTDLRDRLRVELSAEGLTNLLRGRETPVLKPLLDLLMKDRLEDINFKFKALDDFMKEVRDYIQRVENEKPADGESIKAAFGLVANELTEIKSAAFRGASSGSAPASSAGQAAPPPASETDKLRNDLADIHAQVSKMAAERGNCHCVHVDQLDGRAIATQTQLDAQARVITTLEKSIEMMRSRSTPAPGSSEQPPPPATSFLRPDHGKRAWANYKPGCNDGDCGDDHGDHGDPRRASGPSDPWFVSEGYGGNGSCHCVHVNELRAELDELKAQMDMGDEGGFDPWSGGGGGSTYGGYVGRRTRPKPQPLPIKIGPIGQLQDVNARLFDDRMAAQPAFQFDGSKGGAAWKSKIERYLMSKIPALSELLHWAERYEGEKIDEAFLVRATFGSGLDQPRIANLNSSIWGFLSAFISGEAETIFKGADALQGIDAWRRLIAYIDHGKNIKLEGMRTDMKMLHTRTIKNLETVLIGIAEFELQIKEYVECGGIEPTNEEKKSDLLRLLPEHLQDNLLWRATDPGPYIQFRDMIKAQAARTLLNRRRLPIHTVAEASPPSQDDEMHEELMAVMKKFNFRNAKRQPPRQPGSPAAAAAAARAPRFCPNCSGSHPETRCPHPDVDRGQRTCWTCKKSGHSNKNCPQRASKSLKSLDEEVFDDIRRLGVCESAPSLPTGFQTATRTFRQPSKPTPQRATLGDFIHVNRYTALSTASSPTLVSAAPWESAPTMAALPKHQPTTTILAEIERIETTVQQDLENLTLSLRQGHQLLSTESVRRASPEPGQVANLQQQNMRMLAAVDRALDEMKLNMLDYGDVADDNGHQLLATTPTEVKIAVAADSGAVAHVINPRELPSGSRPDGIVKTHFVGASNEHIENYGGCETLVTGSHGRVINEWQCADVGRALHSVSMTTGPADGPGKHDVLFNNKRGVVVPAGVVDKILERITPIFEYTRRGGLYIADVTVSSFPRPGNK